MLIPSLGVSGGVQKLMQFDTSSCYKELKKSGKISQIDCDTLCAWIAEMVPYILSNKRFSFYNELVECIENVKKESSKQDTSYELLNTIEKKARPLLECSLEQGYFFNLSTNFEALLSKNSSTESFIEMTKVLMSRYTDPDLQEKLEQKIFKNLAEHQNFSRLKLSINKIFNCSKRCIITKKLTIDGVQIPLSQEEKIIFITKLGGNFRVRLPSPAEERCFPFR
ncbi:hypothetical protein HCUR_01454 [Holospora curviuscula]|uniref:Uncharacterized protein n=2 Tax=Holospora curviuscula TaxID=1082868 RepID=A0A2S5R713_9PROT|nr:hypothetical protein HCUR_01454 [Holospora curviuscula]